MRMIKIAMVQLGSITKSLVAQDINDKIINGGIYKFHYFPMQAQVSTEGTFVVSAARTNDAFAHKQIVGHCIISSDGEILAKTEKMTKI